MPGDLWDKFASGGGMGPGDEPPPPEDHEEAGSAGASAEGVDPLGYDRGVYYYFSRAARQVYALSPPMHTQQWFTAMASVPHYWERDSQFRKRGGGIDWHMVADVLMRSCRGRGIYDPDRIRGRGAWLDDGRAVLHMGDHLLVGGTWHSLSLPRSRYVYEAAARFTDGASRPPLPARQAHRLVEICCSLRWERPISGTLLAGWILIAPICGGLAWRPSIWLTGPKGSGKTTVEAGILAPALGKIALHVQSVTTEPALRRALGSDARPVLFDEAEQEGLGSAARMQAVLGLVRQSSSESGGEILKAAQGDGLFRFRIRSCFAFSSINVGIEHSADESRITVLALRVLEATTPEARARAEAEFKTLMQTIGEVITEDFSAGLLARAVALLPIIRRNAETFARAVSIHLGTRRLGDQLGTLLAGAYALHSDKAIGDAEAEAFIRRERWDSEVEQASDRDEDKLLTVITQSRVAVTQGTRIEATVGRLIAAVAHPSDREAITAETADRELKQMGIRFERAPEAGIWVSSSHPALRRLLAGTPWASSWSRSLSRLPGASVAQRAKRFAFGHQARAVWIPWIVLEPEEPP